MTDLPARPHIIRGRRVVTRAGIGPAVIHIKDGRISRLGRPEALPSGDGVLDAGDLVVMPGLVDTHVHVNEPGRSDWEGFETATAAAAAGGVTTLLDMPLNSIPATTTLEALRAKAESARQRCHVDVGFIAGVVPGNAGSLGELADAGVRCFKCFLVPSGVPEFPHVDAADLRAAMPEINRLGALLMVHSELPGPIESALRGLTDADPRRYGTYLASRPAAAEYQAARLVIRLAEETRARVHIVHVSSPETARMIRVARSQGIRLTAETCPHYLTFAAEEIADGATELKCAPPIRSSKDREGLWTALQAGDLEMVVTDHSPCPPAMKLRDRGDFLGAWGGISSLQLSASVMWTEMRRRDIGIEQLVRWMSDAPARLAGLEARKGQLAPGSDADFVLFDSDAEWTVEPDALLHRHKVTPYAGHRLTGRVEATYLRGELVYEHGGPRQRAPVGRLLLASEGDTG